MLLSFSARGQNPTLTLTEALNIARTNYAGLEREQLSVRRQNELAKAGRPMQPTQIFLSGDEFDFDGLSGVQGLNLQQIFYLPKVNKVQRAYYERGAAVAQKQLQLTGQELQRAVTLAYRQVQYAAQARALADENLVVYTRFLDLTTRRLQAGEDGKIPQLAARSRRQQARLALEQAEATYQAALAHLNDWLLSDTFYQVSGTLPDITSANVSADWQNNVHLQLIQAHKEQAAAGVKTQEALLLPQISSGLRLQNSFGQFPVFGYQAGVNIPLFQKAYNTRIEAARVEVAVAEAALKAEQQQLERRVSDLRRRMDQQVKTLRYLQEEVQPVLEEQSTLNRQAFREGETTYLEYFDALEQILRSNRQHLDALFQYHVLLVELNYWLGK